MVQSAGLAHSSASRQLPGLSGSGAAMRDGGGGNMQFSDAQYSAAGQATITEGRNRQVRRMVEAIGSRVLKLVRTAIGPIAISSLEIGKHRRLAESELALLRAACGEARSQKRPLKRSGAAGTSESPGRA